MTNSMNPPSSTDLDNRKAELAACIDAMDRKGADPTARDVARLETLTAEVDRLRRAHTDDCKAFLYALGNTNGDPNSGAPRTGWSDDNDAKGGMFSTDQKSGLLRAIASNGSYGTNVKAPTLGGALLPTGGKAVSLATSATGLLPLANLFQEVSTETPTVRVYKLTTGSASVVAEGALKPDAGIVTTAVDTPLVKIATTFQLSSELLEDAGFLVDSIERQAITGVVSRENVTLVASLAAASGALTGTGTKAAALDVLAAGIGAAEAANGVTPTAVLMAPADLAIVRQAKASTGGSYFVDPLLSGPTTIHGVALTSTPAVPSGTAYLVSAGAGLFYRRGPVRVDAGYNADDWQRNLVTVRVEERVLPVVVRGELVSKLTLT